MIAVHWVGAGIETFFKRGVGGWTEGLGQREGKCCISQHSSGENIVD